MKVNVEVVNVEVEIYGEQGRIERTTIKLTKEDIADIAEKKALEQFFGISAVAKKIEVQPYTIEL